MSLNSTENKDSITTGFPSLSFDEKFEITSPKDSRYNCIAWAADRNDIWWWPYIPQLDGSHWPIPEKDFTFDNLIRVFQGIGYRVCESDAFEPKFKKVALYVDEAGDFTHASRQLRSGLWTSKLGREFDISHENPYLIEGDIYGKVGVIMSTKF